jgi:hypothetical protein
MNSHPSNLALKSAGGNTHNSKPQVVVSVVRGVSVANTGAAVVWVVVPGTAPHQLG